MQIMCKDLGERRWICHIKFDDWVQQNEFDRWLASCENMSLWCRPSQFAPQFDYEIRGGTVSDRTMFLLRWS